MQLCACLCAAVVLMLVYVCAQYLQLKAQAKSWHPLQHPEWGAKTLLHWKDVLLKNNTNGSGQSDKLLAASDGDMYSRMIEDIIFPRIRRALQYVLIARAMRIDGEYSHDDWLLCMQKRMGRGQSRCSSSRG
jgi:hypothetical protein